MIGFLLRTLIVMLGLGVASLLILGIHIRDGWTLFGAALVLGLVNAMIRPVLVFLTLPITILTLGLFLLVINAAMLGLVAWLFDGFAIDGFWAALFGAVIVSITGWAASWFIGPRGRIAAVVATRERR